MGNRLFLAVIAIFIVVGIVAGGTTGKIKGKVVDKNTNKPIPYANVFLENTSIGAATDENGEYIILNVPVGTYNIRCNVIGYKILTKKNIRVIADLTTEVNFEMEQTVIEGEQVTIVAKRPVIQVDLTASRNIITSEQMENLPLGDVTDAVNLTAGFVDGHARGGRDGEVAYHINGIPVVDPMTGYFNINIPDFAVEEMSVITSGFDAEYSNAQSGIVNIVTKEGREVYEGRLRFRTSDVPLIRDHHREKNLEFSLGGPLFLKNMTFYLAGELRRDNGRFDNQDQYRRSFSLNLSYRPTKKDKISFDGIYSDREYGLWGVRWDNTTVENEDLDGDGKLDTYHWEFDSETGEYIKIDDDGDGNFLWEDFDQNGEITVVDLNHDGDYADEFDMLDHLPELFRRNQTYGVKWTHFLSERTFFEVRYSLTDQSFKYNVRESINEDLDGDGHLDLYYDIDGDGVKEDVDGDFDNRHEDLNGNLIWDWKEYGDNVDLFVDEDNDDYIDASQKVDWNNNGIIGDDEDKEHWMEWKDVTIGNSQDLYGYYNYGNGTTFYRLRWNQDSKISQNLKVTLTSQITDVHKVKAGFELTYYDIFDHDVDLASGGNVYGQNIGRREGWGQPGQPKITPRIGGAFIQDKMEYPGLIVNVGLRFDYFDPDVDEWPEDLEDPVVDPTMGGEVKNPVKVKPKFYWSPRLGISHPITDKDVLYFNYGRYFQIPIFRLLYTNINWDLSGAFPMIGNPDINPETTYSYEVGIRHQISEGMKIEIKAFYKDIQGLTDTRQIYYTAANYYTLYYNLDYGNVRGIEIDFWKMLGRYWGGSINYTYSVALGKSSSSRQNYDLTWAGQIIPKKEAYLDWDQRHTINADLQFRIPWTNTLFDMVVQYGSGLPYSPTPRTLEVPINTERRPWTLNSRLSISQRFRLASNISMEVFFWVNNLFNKRNLIDIVDVDWYENYTDIQKRYEKGELSEEEYLQLMDTGPNGVYDGRENDPFEDGKPDWNKLYPAGGRYGDKSVYSEGRTFRLGIGLVF